MDAVTLLQLPNIYQGQLIRIVPERGPQRVMRVSHVEHHIITLTDVDEED